MLTLINKTDQTNNVPYDSIQISMAAGDQAGQAQFQVVDPGAVINLQLMQEVIFIDENATYGNATSAMVPGHNYLGNESFNFGSTSWTDIGTLSGRITYPSNPTWGAGAVATLTFSNQAVGTALGGQKTNNAGVPGFSYAIVGQKYWLSATINATSAFTNSYAYLQINFLDVGGNTLSSAQSSHITSTSGAQRFSVSGTAPAGTVLLQAVFGGATTSTTNSGTATFTAVQLEPEWFPGLYSYPTPLCGNTQADCAVIWADGTLTRFDRIFCGSITHLSVSYEGTTRTWDVQAVSLDGWLENSNLLTKSYTNASDQSMITDALGPTPIFTLAPSTPSSTPNALAYNNASFVYSGINATIEYADATPREVCNAVADISSFLFGIDAYYNCYYHPRYYNAAMYAFSSSPDNVTTFAYYDYSIEYDGSQLQNAINVSGGNYQLQITDTYTTTTSTTSVVLSHYPIELPSSVVADGTTLVCQIDTGAGWPSGVTALASLSYPYVSFLNPVASGKVITVTYVYNALVYVQAKSPDSIAEFGRTLYSKINDNNLTSNASAATRGEAQLVAYAQPLTTIKFKTTKMVSVGQVIVFTSALDNLTNAHFAVQKVTATYLGNGINQYDIEAGVYIDDLIDFFRNTQKATNRVNHSTTEPIKQYNNLQQDSLSLSDSLNIHT